MKRQLFSTFLLLLFSMGVSAQTDRAIDKIRKFYENIAERARLAETDEEHGQYDELFMNELVLNKLNHQWRAVGRHINTYKFFYKVVDDEDERHMYPDQLVMVKVERQESNRTYTEEYLYSIAGVLLFHYQKFGNDDLTPVERRV
ncbi:MAG: hypothetical protein ABIO36_02795, partial [Pyrinomonadaceae bacterium]